MVFVCEFYLNNNKNKQTNKTKKNKIKINPFQIVISGDQKLLKINKTESVSFSIFILRQSKAVI